MTRRAGHLLGFRAWQGPPRTRPATIVRCTLVGKDQGLSRASTGRGQLMYIRSLEPAATRGCPDHPRDGQGRPPGGGHYGLISERLFGNRSLVSEHDAVEVEEVGTELGHGMLQDPVGITIHNAGII